jgi:hypothetical protein
MQTPLVQLKKYGIQALVAIAMIAIALSSAIASPISLHRAAHREALSLAVASRTFSQEELSKLLALADSGGEPDSELLPRWQRLLDISQAIILLRELPDFHSIGFEFESAHQALHSNDKFAKGAHQLLHIASRHFGATGKPTLGADEKKATLVDHGGQTWTILPEYVRSSADSVDGWETITPPFFNPDYFRLLAPFLLDLEKSQFGRPEDMTATHITLGLSPIGQSDSKVEALTAVNYLLMLEQFLPAMSRLISTARYGGIAKNFFIRPASFDHPDMLVALSQIDPKSISWKAIHRLLFETHIEREFESQLASTPVFDDAEKSQMQRGFSKDQRHSYRSNWKYRPWKLRFDSFQQGYAIETRIADFTGKPEQTLRASLMFQLLMAAARKKALHGQVWQIRLPDGKKVRNGEDFYRELEHLSASSTDAFLSLLREVATDKSVVDFVAGQRIPIRGALWSASDNKKTFGFEVETRSAEFVRLILPYDPGLKRHWQGVSLVAKLDILRSLGFEMDAPYSSRSRRVLSTQFYVDFQAHPRLDAELHQEESSNIEFKSNGAGIYSVAELKNQAATAVSGVREGRFGVHFHAFLPQAVVDQLKDSGKVDEFVDFIERLSLTMQLFDYREAAVSARPKHSLDSWSLDRFSPQDLEEIRGWLNGSLKISNLKQKFHNIGFRPVRNGLDLELRSVSRDIDYGTQLMGITEQAINEMSFSDQAYLKDPALFHEFRDIYPDSIKREHTFSWALDRRFQLTELQKEIARKLQFEIYKPSMSEFMAFPDGEAINTIGAAELSTEFLRTNFESNSALALLDYESQSFISPEELRVIQQKRLEFLDGLYGVVLKIEQNPNYRFILEHEKFLHLCDYMARSTHPSKPSLQLVPTGEAVVQREHLESLVFEVRKLSTKFVSESNITLIAVHTLKPTGSRPVYSTLLRSKSLAISASSTRAATHARNRGPIRCNRLFGTQGR